MAVEVATRQADGLRRVIELHGIEASKPPSNQGFERTVKSDTPFEERRAKAAPLVPVAHTSS